MTKRALFLKEIFAAILILLMAVFVVTNATTKRPAFVSSEVHFADTSSKGLSILPASCASDVTSYGWYHHHVLRVSPGALGYYVSPGQSDYGDGSHSAEICVSNNPTHSGTWTVPSNWNNANNTIEVIGGGGGGAYNNGGGGGAAYSKVTNLTLVPNSGVSYTVGYGGSMNTDGEDTWFGGASCAGSSVCAVGGKGAYNGNGAAGGLAASGVGTVKYSGGNGSGAGLSESGGGGAAGPYGNGGNAGTALGSNNGGSGGGGGGGGTSGGNQGGGQNNGSAGGTGPAASGSGAGGAGGTSASKKGKAGTNGGGGGGGYGSGGVSGTAGGGGDGGNGTEWDPDHGAGGGGGGAGWGGSWSGGNGGLYGGGGGGASGEFFTGGSGGMGLIVITYTPSGGTQQRSYINAGNIYFIPANTAAELNAFKAAGGSIPGLQVN